MTWAGYRSIVENHMPRTVCLWHAASHRPGCCALLTLLAIVAFLCLPAPVRAATPNQVEDAIKKGKAFILAHQEPDGSWEQLKPNMPPGIPPAMLAAIQASMAGRAGGISALVTYGLLAAGQDPKSPEIVKAVKFLSNLKMDTTYGVALRCQVWNHLPRDTATRQLSAHDAALLLGEARNHDPQGFFSYTLLGNTPKFTSYDNSNSQYGVLGLWAAAEMGVEISDAIWSAMDKGWRAHQEPDGGWAYMYMAPFNFPVPAANPHAAATPAIRQMISPSTVSMTAAGLASLFIMQDMLHGNDHLTCTGNAADPNIDKGLEWMGNAFRANKVDFSDRYALYGIERIGVASGRRYLGATDWFAVGADDLVRTQAADGSWNGMGICTSAGPSGLTAFCLLFLASGRAPVMANKLQYDIDTNGDKPVVANWNQRPRDMAHLAKWAGKQCETLLNWQVVNLSVPVEELHDAPILYIAGDQTLSFNDANLAKLRLFIEQGGLIVGNADCDKPAFVAAFKKLGQKLAPAYEFTPLPAIHAIFTSQQFHADKWRHKPNLDALSNGARVLMLLLPSGDCSRLWQTNTYIGHEEAYEVMSDIFLYAVDKKGLRAKGDTYIVTPDPALTPYHAIKVARLEYAGNWNPEPGGWRRLAAVMHNKDLTSLTITTLKLGDGKLDNTYPVAHLTGTVAFTLADDALAELKKYVDGGGTLIIDSAGGGGDCADSAEKAIAQIWPDQKLELLKPDDPLYCSACDSVSQVVYRVYARQVFGASTKPRLRALRLDNRPAVILSTEDISVGMVGMEIDGIVGYTPASATNLMRNLLLHVCPPPTIPTSQPTPPQTQPAGNGHNDPIPGATTAAADQAAALKATENVWHDVSAPPVDILPDLRCTAPAEKQSGGAILLNRSTIASSIVSYHAPVTFRMVLVSDNKDLRLGFAADQIIFNWEVLPDDLRVEGGPIGGQHKPGAGRLPNGLWTALEMSVTTTEAVIFVNGAERYRAKGDFSTVRAPMTLDAHRGPILLGSFSVIQHE